MHTYATLAATLADNATLEVLATIGRVSPTVASVGTYAGGTVVVAMHPCAEFVVYAGPRGVCVEWADEETLGEDVVPGIYFAMDLPFGMVDATIRATGPKLMHALNALHA